MTMHEFGKENEKVIVLLHPSAVMWDYFDFVVPLLKNDYHLIIPAFPGYDKNHPEQDFTSVEDISAALASWLNKKNLHTIDLLYGCSMGGGIAIRMIADQHVEIRNAVIDGGITPYQLPWIATRFISVRDFLAVSMGKIGGLRLLEKAFSTDEYSKKDLKYVVDVMHFMSFKTIWRTFDSCNNYSMPDSVPDFSGRLQYWYGDKEERKRAWDIRYMKKHFPKTEFIKIESCGHGSMASLRPQEMADRIRQILGEEEK